ncbi:transcription termination/antitermination protein NusG [Patescibacteria group bacterium]|nr:transcription termination/antitermination protein NusG [Patescibacteria group bacterium]MCL5797672.1 transcription termination/antitermination protein NusG [Patescibacteria group bacterium]
MTNEDTKNKEQENIASTEKKGAETVPAKTEGATENTSTQPTTPPPSHPDEGKWFVIHTYSGHENKAAAAMRQRIDTMNLSAKIFEVVVPMRNIVVVRHGKKEETKEKIFPGYILVRMNLDDESWLAVRTTPGVTAFVGAGNKPTPISDKEVEAILKFTQLSAPKFKTKFSKGEAVKIVDGPFADFLGTVDSIDEDKGKVKVLVSIFGRETPVELDFLQVSKL